ncbi:MAG: radical SAM/SPASM domain-containing protein [Nitrospirota bacterium]
MNKLTHLLLLGVSYKSQLIKPWNYPYQFTIEPTNICNYKCVFCPQSESDHKLKRRQGALTIENMRLFLDQVREVKSGNSNVSLTLDGEPTLNKNLPEFIRLINAEGLLPRFSSNGRNLSPSLVDALAASGSFFLSVDFASEAQYFDTIRGGKGDFEIVLENLRYIANIARKKQNIKVELVNISHFSGAEPEKTLRDLKDLFPADLPKNVTFRTRQFHNFCGHLNLKGKEKYVLCPYPWTTFTVTWNGDVVPCCRDTNARTVLGNVYRQTVPEIWYGKRYENLRRKLIAQDIGSIAACKNCDLPWSSGTSRWKWQYMKYSLLRR